jgi:hypothetical protein
MMRPKLISTVVLLLLTVCAFAKVPDIFYLKNTTPTENLAAKELQRYIYLRTGLLPELKLADKLSKIPEHSIIIASVTEIHESALKKLIKNDVVLGHDDYQLTSALNGSLIIKGGSDIAVLYGAYKFLTTTGISFEIQDDIIPDDKTSDIVLTGFDKIYSPSFALRGIQPFHDFPEGPDWWSKDDYDAIIAQLPKLGMNFIGFHTYPETRPFGGWSKAEPMVWIGNKENINANGTVQTAYPVLHANTGDSTWAYYPKNTSDFHFGASQIFESDIYGAPYMQNISNWPHTDQENVNIFNQVGSLLNNAFTLAKRLGVKTCMGTETPLAIPDQVKQANKGMTSDSLSQALYEGIFTRIIKTHPLDYYWFWTPESWTWEGEANDAVEQTEKDLQNALSAAKKVNAPFTLATCGWVLGPARDRAEFDRILPKVMPFGVINRQTGFTPVEPSFAKINGRPKWEISWLEDDPALTAPQLWAGRVVKDAIDAYKYGCTGFMGIHWRTENLSPTFMALAEAGWDAKYYKKMLPDSVRDYPVDSLYLQWAKHQFGTKAARQVAKIFIKLDGAPLYINGKNQMAAHFPRSAEWGKRGPGKIVVNMQPWKIVQEQYSFVEDYKSLKPLITGVSNIDRYDYWLNNFCYAEAQAHVGCLLGEMQIAADRLKKDHLIATADSIIAIRDQAASAWGVMVNYLLQTVNTTGEMGTVANLEQHSLGSLRLLNAQDSLITAITGKPVPPVNLAHNYSGLTRLIITTKRTLLSSNEDLNLKVRVLSNQSISNATIFWRPLGKGSFTSKSLTHLARNVYSGLISSSDVQNKSFEYYVTVSAGTMQLRYPKLPDAKQTVVVF